MIVKRKVEDWHVRFLTLTGIVDYHEYDFGYFNNGEHLIYENDTPKYLFDLFDGTETAKSIRQIIDSFDFKDVNQFVEWWGNIIGKKLSTNPNRPFGIPLQGFFEEPVLKEISFEVFEINLELLEKNLLHRK